MTGHGRCFLDVAHRDAELWCNLAAGDARSERPLHDVPEQEREKPHNYLVDGWLVAPVRQLVLRHAPGVTPRRMHGNRGFR